MDTRRHSRHTGPTSLRGARLLLALILSAAALALAAPVNAAVLPAGFQESTAIGGLTYPTDVRFAADGRVFVAEKSGIVKVFDSLSDTTPTTFADLRTKVHDYWDRGLLGLALHPSFPSQPWVYVLYTYDFDPNSPGQQPRWGDACASPPGPTADGCVVSGRLSRLQAAGDVMTGAEQVLVEDWCQQYPSHSVGALEFGPDGALYVSGGEGASFTFTDYGQDGNPVNPCGDPPGGRGGPMTPPTAEGGALRSQDLRTGADPTGLHGAILRLDAATGAPLPDNPNAGGPDANARRIIAHGLRNPFRFAVRPGSGEIWAGDVGQNGWEEINRVSAPTAAVRNFGWPCYEGGRSGSAFVSLRQSSYDNTDLAICEGLYAAGVGAVTAPHFSYSHSAKVVTGESCPTGSSSISGMAFYDGGPYPASYDGALFFADYARGCIWAMPVGVGGLPDPAAVLTFVAAAANPVGLRVGPNGDLFYVNFSGAGDGSIMRVSFPTANGTPTAVATATPASGAAPLAVTFDGAGSTDPDGDALAYAWDLDGDGAFDDATGPTASRTYTQPGTVNAALRVTDPSSASDVDTVAISVGNTAPTATVAAPTEATTWAVGEQVAFSGSASDAQQGALPASALSWSVIMHHCDPGGSCHSHPLQTISGVASGAFTAPDHEYPSFLELRLTATDAGGLTGTASVEIDPRTTSLTLQTSPTGLQVSSGSQTGAAPLTRTVIQGSTNSIATGTPQLLSGTSYGFTSWSDGGARNHDVVVSSPTTLTATFTAQGPPPPPPTGLVAAWGFDAGSGPQAADASGNGHAGTISGAAWSAAGRHGQALNFDGVNDWVTVADAAALDLTNRMTLSAWVRPDTLGAWRNLIMKETSANLAYSLYAHDGTRPASWVYTNQYRSAAGGSALPLNAWSHLAVTYDGATLRLYRDGAQLAQTAFAQNMITSTQPLRIGGNNIWGEYFDGLIDEVRIYNRALSATEIQADMAAPVSGGPPPPDTTPPTVSVTSPAAGATVSGTVSVSAGAADNVGVAGVRFTLDGAPLGAEDTSAPYSVSWNTTTASGGAHTLRAIARDAAGNETTSAPVGVTVNNAPPPPDTTPPTVSVTSPAAGATVSGTVSVSAGAADNVGVAGVRFTLDGAPLGAEDTSAPYSVSWNTTTASGGAHTLRAIARDAAGNETTSAPVGVTVDNAPPPPDTTPPTVSVTSPAAGATVSGTVSVSAGAADNVGVAGVRFTLDGAPLGAEDTSAPYSVSWNTTTASGGAHTLRAIARDAAGNETTSAPVGVTVDNAPPPPPPTGLVAAWGFDAGSGPQAADASGNGHAGTISGAAWSAAGRHGQALNFDGVNDWVTVADAAALDLTNRMTLSAWVRPDTLGAWRNLIMKETSANLAYSLYAHDGTRPASWVYTNQYRSAAGGSALPLNAWSHLAVTYDGATLRLYRDGAQLAQTAFAQNMITSTQPLRIGGNNIWGEYFDGLIDEVRIYNRALSATEIQADMAAPVSG